MKIEEKIALYLNEGRSKEVDFQFASDFILKKCRKAATGTPIYRGNRKLDKDYYYINPKTSDDRISPWADYNFYNLLFSNLYSWKKYPKRNKSIICTTNYNEAKNRNNKPFPYRIFPVDGSDIGVCPEWDIWDSFKDALDGNDLEDFNYILNTFLEKNLPSGILWGQRADVDYSIFVKQCDLIDKIPKSDINALDFKSSDSRQWLYDWIESDEPFLYYLSQLLSPDKNGFKLVKSGAKNLDSKVEVWTAGECIMVLDNKVEDILSTETE